MEGRDEEEDFDQTMTVTISLHDDDAKRETLDGTNFFDFIEQPSTSNFLLKVRPEIVIGQLPSPILRVLELRLNSPAVGSMRNWEYISMLLGMSLDEITLIRSHSNPMEQVLGSLQDVPFNALLTSIADSHRIDLLICLRPHLRHIDANLTQIQQKSSNISVIQAQPGPSRRPITIQLPPKFILVTHHEPPKPKNNQQFHSNTTDSAIDVSSSINSANNPTNPNKQFRLLWANLKKWSDTAGLPVFDIDKCINESNTIASLQQHFQQATHIILVPSQAYSEEVCSSKTTTDGKVEIKRQLQELMQMEYLNNGRKNERFRVIILDVKHKEYLPMGWPMSTIVYTFPDNYTDIVQRLFT